MFRIILIKEVQESLLDYRYWIVTALCLLLIPLGMYVAREDFESRLKEYAQDVKLYQETSYGNVGNQFNAQAFRPPSQLSVFSHGFGDHLPYRVETHNDGYFRTYSKLKNTNLLSVLFGRIDFSFVVISFLSLLAMIMTFSAVSSEKENGTAKLILSNSISRASFIIAKILGSYIVFQAAFIVSFIIGLLILHGSESINIFDSEFISGTVFILVFTLLYLLLFFNLGIWISSYTRNSINSVILLMFIWMFFTLIVPRISPMIANIVLPVKSEEFVQKEIHATKRQLTNEMDKKGKKLLESIVTEAGISFDNFFTEFYGSEYISVREEYDRKYQSIYEDYSKRIRISMQKLANDHQLAKRNQTLLAMNLSRISPSGCYALLVSELSGTGIMEMENFQKHAEKFQDQVSKEVYENFIYQKYWYKGNRTSGSSPKEGFNSENLQVPGIHNYQHSTAAAVFQTIWVDLVILILFTFIFFYAAFVSFLRFDVR